MIKLIVKAQTEEGTKEFNYEFDQPVVTIGRLKDNDIQLPVSTVSGFHAQILKEGSDYYLIDRGSINATYLNGQRLIGGEKKLLSDGDLIRIQSFELYFSSGVTMMGNVDQGATVQVARQMVMEVLGSWKTTNQEKQRIILMGGPNNGKQYELNEGKTLVVGRTAECDIQIDHPSVSRRHAEIALSWSGTFINDLSSANGVFVDDQRITGSQKLRDRNEIRLGQQTSPNPVILVFSNPAEALLSKIESMQITDSNPGVVSSKELTDAAEKQMAGKAEEAGVVSVAPAPATPEKQDSSSPVAAEAQPDDSEPSGFSRILGMPGAIVVILLLVVVLGILGFILFSGKSDSLTITAEPIQGAVGDTITLIGENLQDQEIQGIRVLNKNARITQAEEDQIQIQLPQIGDLEGIETRTDIVVEGPKGLLAQIPFTYVTKPQIESLNPQSGGTGTEIRVKTNKVGSNASVYFGSNQAIVKSRNKGELVAVVPKPAEAIPDNGLSVPVTIRVNEIPSANTVNFLVLSEQRKPGEVQDKFELAFVAKPYPEALGFNEYSVETNVAPLLVLAAADEYASSRERAEAVAKNLNEAKDEFKKDGSAEVVLHKEEEAYALHAGGGSAAERLLTRVLPEDAQAYSKLNRRTVGLQELSEWWQMLLASYYRVFVQIQDPAGTGILSSGGGVLQQIFKFYPIGKEGEKYYKKDFVNSLPSDQRGRLISLSFAIPYVVSRVDGKWSGAMTNELYSNISAKTLELNLILRQQDNGSIGGTAEMTWKIFVDSSGGNYENVGFKKLGIFNLNGTYQKGRSNPLEFSFVEKDSRRLNFSGKVDGNILKGKYVTSGGEEGTWTVQHLK